MTVYRCLGFCCLIPQFETLAPQLISTAQPFATRPCAARVKGQKMNHYHDLPADYSNRL